MNMNLGKDFENYATKHVGINSLALHDYQSVTAGYINPHIIEERKLNIASLDVFSRLMMERIVFLGCAIDDTVANIITAQLLYLDSTGHEEIKLYLNTPGGGVHSGLAIYDTMNFVKSPVSTLVAGMAASMGFVLAVAGQKGKRVALKHSRLMQHQPMGGCHGQASDMEITVRQINILKKELYEIISQCTGHDMDKITKDCDRDYWMTAAESKEYGAIDEIIGR